MGEEPNRTTARKPGPLEIIQYSLGKCFNSGYVDVAHEIAKNIISPPAERHHSNLSLYEKRKRYSQSIYC